MGDYYNQGYGGYNQGGYASGDGYDRRDQGGYAPPAGPPPVRYGYDVGYAPPSNPPPVSYGGYQGGYDERYGVPNGPPPVQYREEEYYDPPTGVPPPVHYQPTGAGFMPQEQYQSSQPPYGEQYTNDAGPRQQNYGPQMQGPDGQVTQPYFEYSKCDGKKKALLIGINYFGTSAELNGCINDAQNVQRFICERFGYDPSDMVVLTDDAADPRQVPTKENILKAMGWLVAGAERDDSLFFHYSGHGTQAEDVNGDEGDDDDEAICPVDYQEAGLIIDDDIHELLVRPLPAGCRLTAIFDSCHSGTVMDLPYVYSTEGKIKEPDLFEGTADDLMGAGVSALTGNTEGLFKGLFGIAKGAWDTKQADAVMKKTKTSAADVIQWAGCKDSQTSADTEEAGKATGAMSYAFIEALRKYPNQSYQQLLVTVREEMRGRYTQKPQLSACHPIDTSLQFVA